MKTVVVAVAAVMAVLGGAAAAQAADQIDTAMKFMLGWGKGVADDVAASAVDKVPVSVGGKESALADVKLVLPFKGLSTVREGGKVKAVTVDELAVKAGTEDKKGKGRLDLEEKDGKFKVTKVTIE